MHSRDVLGGEGDHVEANGRHVNRPALLAAACHLHRAIIVVKRRLCDANDRVRWALKSRIAS